MVNRNYQKGARYERKLVNEAKAEGNIAFRSAGSHSPIDVCVVNSKDREIRLIQAKIGGHHEREKKKLLKEF